MSASPNATILDPTWGSPRWAASKRRSFSARGGTKKKSARASKTDPILKYWILGNVRKWANLKIRLVGIKEVNSFLGKMERRKIHDQGMDLKVTWQPSGRPRNPEWCKCTISTFQNFKIITKQNFNFQNFTKKGMGEKFLESRTINTVTLVLEERPPIPTKNIFS